MCWNVTPSPEGRPRILIVRLGAMGDVIHTLPAAADLRRALPDAYLAWAVESRWAALLESNPDLNRVIPVALRDWRRAVASRNSWNQASALVREMQAADFDLALDFQGLLKSAAVARLSGAPRVGGLERPLLREPLAELAYSSRISASSRHVVDRYREVGAFAAPVASPSRAAFPLPPGTPKAGLPDRFILASPGAGWGAKEWPSQHYASLASTVWREHRIPMLADCPLEQDERVAAIRDASPPGAVVPHASTIPELIGATRKAAAVVGVDSGPLHLAAALKTPGVAIFGPTDPARNGPYSSVITVVRSRTAETTYKRSSAPAPAMRDCSPDLVYEALRPILQ